MLFVKKKNNPDKFLQQKQKWLILAAASIAFSNKNKQLENFSIEKMATITHKMFIASHNIYEIASIFEKKKL